MAICTKCKSSDSLNPLFSHQGVAQPQNRHKHENTPQSSQTMPPNIFNPRPQTRFIITESLIIPSRPDIPFNPFFPQRINRLPLIHPHNFTDGLINITGNNMHMM